LEQDGGIKGSLETNMTKTNWTIEDFKRAVWQYLKEHRQFKIEDIVKKKKRFWGKIAARRKNL
jgi:hypothetical protein